MLFCTTYCPHCICPFSFLQKSIPATLHVQSIQFVEESGWMEILFHIVNVLMVFRTMVKKISAYVSNTANPTRYLSWKKQQENCHAEAGYHEVRPTDVFVKHLEALWELAHESKIQVGVVHGSHLIVGGKFDILFQITEQVPNGTICHYLYGTVPGRMTMTCTQIPSSVPLDLKNCIEKPKIFHVHLQFWKWDNY